MRQDVSTGQVIENGQPLATNSAQTTTLSVKVWSPFRVYYQGVAASISGNNGAGPFDILPRHHNFISLLEAGDLVLQPADGELRIHISSGIMQVHDNRVTVFLEV